MENTMEFTTTYSEETAFMRTRKAKYKAKLLFKDVKEFGDSAYVALINELASNRAANDGIAEDSRKYKRVLMGQQYYVQTLWDLLHNNGEITYYNNQLQSLCAEEDLNRVKSNKELIEALRAEA